VVRAMVMWLLRMDSIESLMSMGAKDLAFTRSQDWIARDRPDGAKSGAPAA
jgi:hypothetical protein